jgi:type IV secretion system protein VirB4
MGNRFDHILGEFSADLSTLNCRNPQICADIFALKGGGYGCLFSLEGVDPESCADDDLDARTRDIEASLRGLPQDACLYQYTRVRAGFKLPRQAQYVSSVTESFARNRLQFLGENAGFRRIDLYWSLTVEPDQANPFGSRLEEHRRDTDRHEHDGHPR